MKFEIPAYKIERLQKEIAKVQRKGANISFEIGDSFDKVFELFVNDQSKGVVLKPVVIKTYNVEIEGQYKIDGWEFVATLEHTENGNIVRGINSELISKMPLKYKTCGPNCEHCNKERNRLDTYLVYNRSENAYKQVGKTCLKDYTRGLTPESCRLFECAYDYIKESQEVAADEVYKEIMSRNDWVGFDGTWIKKIAYSAVKKYGYVKTEESNSTKDRINHITNGEEEIELASDEDIAKVDEYAESIDIYNSNDYLRNAKLCWMKKYMNYRDFSLIGSFVASYFRNSEKIAKEAKKRAETNYVGNIGDKINIEVNSIRVLYTKSYTYGYGCDTLNYLYEIKDMNGNIYIWSTSSELDEDVKSIKATIKDHQEFHGVKQTVITRGRVA